MADTLGVYKIDSHHPQRNFTHGDTRQKPEAQFAELFVEAYQAKFIKIHSGSNKHCTLFVREVPVAGVGIADLVAFSWSQELTSKEFTFQAFEKLDPTVRAFEFKISDWRKGLMQAYRYKYLSHASILVLPDFKTKVIGDQVGLFKKLRVGLWGFSPSTGSISCLYTPRPVQQQIPKYGEKAMRLAAQAVRL